MAECPSPLLNSSGGGTNLTLEAHLQVERLKFVAYGVVSSVIIALGIIGNSINLAVLTRPNLKGPTFVYLTWLAISDLSALLVSLTSMFRLHGMQPRTKTASLYYAHVEMPLVNALMASSVFLVVALTVDRYFSVCLPTRFREVHNERRAKMSIAAAYSVAFLLYVPVCFQKTPVEVEEGEFVACDNLKVTDHAAFRAYLLAKEVTVRLGPVVLLAVLNAAIIVTFRRTMKRRRDMVGQGSGKKYREEKRLIVLLAGIVLLFFVSVTPAAVLTLLNSDDKEFDFGFQLFRAFANTLELSNYAMNFYVYCMCSSEIRRTFVALVTCTKPVPNASSVAGSKPSVESNNKY
ncbi:hypothetical protein JTE90_023760 [Oedothorax gibbosus]|uniref:G-protein coupled receptors family 1 profile domain-containing protein n=1 Tax=Oedothorax gibbosus TaxID=931172 RepID=A0AAV6TUJ6_9ARAC|nr:hypothetical protein JTE90_023760 [Oedothorax gibbosus]